MTNSEEEDWKGSRDWRTRGVTLLTAEVAPFTRIILSDLSPGQCLAPGLLPAQDQ